MDTWCLLSVICCMSLRKDCMKMLIMEENTFLKIERIGWSYKTIKEYPVTKACKHPNLPVHHCTMAFIYTSDHCILWHSFTPQIIVYYGIHFHLRSLYTMAFIFTSDHCILWHSFSPEIIVYYGIHFP